MDRLPLQANAFRVLLVSDSGRQHPEGLNRNACKTHCDQSNCQKYKSFHSVSPPKASQNAVVNFKRCHRRSEELFERPLIAGAESLCSSRKWGSQEA
jgi:hypothetical protein